MLHKSSPRYVLAIIGALLVSMGAFAVGSLLAGQTGVEAADRQQWEYLTVQFTQFGASYSEDGLPVSEMVASNDPAYDMALFGDLICREDLTRIDACKDKVRGEAYYLNLWGQDGWELVSVVDKSTQYMYSVEMIFKRPR